MFNGRPIVLFGKRFYLPALKDVWQDHKYARVCRECCDIFTYITDKLDEDISVRPDEVEDDWRKCFVASADVLGISRKSANVLYHGFGQGNWEHLHLFDEERGYSLDKWASDFAYDLFYCSDRWSVERMLRVHWLFRQWEEAQKREDECE